MMGLQLILGLQSYDESAVDAAFETEVSIALGVKSAAAFGTAADVAIAAWLQSQHWLIHNVILESIRKIMKYYQ